MSSDRVTHHDEEFLERLAKKNCPLAPCEHMKFWRVVWGGFMGGAIAVALAYSGFIGNRIDGLGKQISETEKSYAERMGKLDSDNRSISESIARMEERLTTNLEYIRRDIKELQTNLKK
jgi:hypothetical protein